MILIEPIQKPASDGESDFHSSGTKPNTTGSSRAVSKSEEEPGAVLRCRAVHVFGRFSVLATKRLTNICTFCGLSRQTGRAVEAFLWRFPQPVPEIGLDMPRYASLVVQTDLPVRASYSPKRYCTCVCELWLDDFEDLAAKSKSKCFLVFSHSKGFGAGHLSNYTLGRSTVGLQSVLPNLPPKLPHSWVEQKYLYAKNPFLKWHLPKQILAIVRSTRTTAHKKILHHFFKPNKLS